MYFAKTVGEYFGIHFGDHLKNGSLYAIGPLSVCSVLSVTLVYCGQTVEWIKMLLDTEVGLAHATLCWMGTQILPPKEGHSPHYCGETVAHVVLLLSTCFEICCPARRYMSIEKVN